MLRLASSISLIAAVAAGSACADDLNFAAMRHAGEVLARAGIETQDPDILYSALGLLLQGGAGLGPGNPWGADIAYAALSEATETSEGWRKSAIDALLASRRGVKGPNEVAFRLAPGQTETVAIGVFPGEVAMIEVRLRRESDIADVDLFVKDQGGAVVLQDAGPETGRVNRGLFLEWEPEACRELSVEIRNVGSTIADGVYFAPAARHRQC